MKKKKLQDRTDSWLDAINVIRRNRTVQALFIIASVFAAGFATSEFLGKYKFGERQLQALSKLREKTSGHSTDTLSENESAILQELVLESQGKGWGVAKYPFQDKLGRLGMTKKAATLAFVNLENRGFVESSEKIGSRGPYPVWLITAKGWSWLASSESRQGSS